MFWHTGTENEELRMFPTLTKLAQLHLSSSAASVPVECMFRTAGLVANGKRIEPISRETSSYLFCAWQLQAAFLTVTLTLTVLWQHYSNVSLVCNNYITQITCSYCRTVCFKVEFKVLESVLKLFKIICILVQNFLLSRNLAENSNSRQNMADPNISRIFLI